MKGCLAFIFILPVIKSQETIVPVGVEGRDSVTFIRSQDNEGNYDVGYNENLLTGGASFHRERGFANGTRTGSYGYTTRSGLIRIVTYVADQDGYRAEVLTNEPGVGSENPSNVTVTKEQEPDLTNGNSSGSNGSLDPNAASSSTNVLYASGSDPVGHYVAYRSVFAANSQTQNIPHS